jgi:GT2 family glycosyltransferase
VIDSSQEIAQIIVVDNKSSDGSERAVEDLPKVKLIRAEDNLGFARACNLGARCANSEFLLFLNPDTRVRSESIDVPLEFMRRKENAGVGICGIALVDEEGQVARTCARFPTSARLVSHAIGLDRLWPAMGPSMREWDHEEPRVVDQIIGAFFLIRRELFESLAGFDERFFVYFEEVDLSLRANILGWRSVFLPDAQAFHAGGGTSRQVKSKRLYYSLRSRLIYAFKHFSVFGAGIVTAATLFVEPLVRSFHSILTGGGASLREIWHGFHLLFRWLPRWLIKGDTR